MAYTIHLAKLVVVIASLMTPTDYQVIATLAWEDILVFMMIDHFQVNHPSSFLFHPFVEYIHTHLHIL
jgi:hypothetical protein